MPITRWNRTRRQADPTEEARLVAAALKQCPIREGMRVRHRHSDQPRCRHLADGRVVRRWVETAPNVGRPVREVHCEVEWTQEERTFRTEHAAGVLVPIDE